ncbi:MAG: NADP-dependent malic enzyme, partial [Alphaproteobacteria bacterium]|nr:NADP-dependent malic enzyme [Alphaproteobacteria bacterium]
LIVEIAPAVAKAAMDSGVARRPIEDFEAYRQKLTQFVFRSGLVMKHVFDRAREAPKRVVFSEGEDERVLRAAQQMIEDKLGFPILIARPEVVETRIKRMGLKLVPGENVEIVNPQSDPRFPEYWKLYHQIMERHGVSPDYARTVVRTRTTAIATLMIKRGEADAMICGTIGRYNDHLRHITDIIGKAEGVRQMSALNLLVLSKGTYFLADTYVTPDPSAEEIADLVVLAADEVRRFGIEPKVALLSHSSFGSHDTPSAVKMREALQILMRRAPDLQVEGEMHGDAAVSEAIRSRIFPSSRLTGPANLFIMPTLDAANISFNLLKVLGEGLSVGPILLGAAMPVHILTPSVTVRGIVNMAALAVVDAQSQETGA